MSARAVRFVRDARFAQHDPGDTHPEAPCRYDAVLAAEVPDGVVVVSADRLATAEALAVVHDATWVDRVLNGPTGAIDHETVIGEQTAMCVRRAVGATLDAVDAAMRDGARTFVAARPPGHHAHRDHGGGYCLVHHAAIGVARALALGAERVAVLDVDAHHGDGTEATLGHDPRVWIASSHERGLFPVESSDDRITDDGRVRRIALPPGCDDATFLDAWAPALAALTAWRPALIVVLWGLDAHVDDPMSSLALTDAAYAQWLHAVVRIADETAQGRIVAVLEGGYDLASLRRGVTHALRALAQTP
ncbi:MAG: hypothetical protein RLZZ383_1859 [Pseudomonadota bacterium]